jgi:hypothetical protein
MKYIGVVLIALMAGACASNTGVVPAGGDTYMIAKQAATGFSGLGNLKGEALQEANQYCVRDGKSMEVVNTSETKPPYLLGNYPRAEVQFRCVAKSP